MPTSTDSEKISVRDKTLLDDLELELDDIPAIDFLDLIQILIDGRGCNELSSSARLAGVRAKPVRRFERGNNDAIRVSTLIRYLNHLGFEPSVLIDGHRLIIDTPIAGLGVGMPEPGRVISFFDLPEIVKGIRLSKGLSLTKASYMSGVPRSTIYGYEAGSTATLIACDYFHYLATLSMQPMIRINSGYARIGDIKGGSRH